jgi:D-tyrosyl-tRNA(Tyr) deacylase
MRGLVQRVTEARVTVGDVVVGEIGVGLVLLVGVTHTDSAANAISLARKVHGLRVLRDELSVADLAGAGVLVVSQFTLYGDARKGRRPTWAAAARAEAAQPLVDAVADELRTLGTTVATGIFRADMRVELVNDGPITLLLEL